LTCEPVRMTLDGLAAEHSVAWSLQVLERGLPALPARLGSRESVPVARWRGPSTAAVLHLRHWLADDGTPESTEVEIECFRIAVDGSWETAGSGGAGGDHMPELTRVDVPPGHADLTGLVASLVDSDGCVAMWGEVGSAAATLEVEQGGEVSRRPVEAPLGWVVVSGEAGSPFTARVRDGSGVVLTEMSWPEARDA
jgi:hypothetical protein